MAELAAIGLASNLLQFAEFGVKLFHLARESYQSGSTAQYEALKDQAKSVQGLAETIRELWRTSDPPAMGKQLRAIGVKCDIAATGLMELLNKLNVDAKKEDKGYKKAWRSFAQALQHVAHEEKVKGSEENLRKVRDELQAYLAAASLAEQRNALRTLKSLCLQNAKLEAKTTTALDEIMQRIEDISSSLQQKGAQGFRDRVSNLETEMKRFKDEKSRVEMHHCILQSLLFDQIKMRQEAIQDSHKATFDWVFERERGANTHFPRWLETDEAMFWIQGKPGSGKSTLMKFLAAHEETRSRLQKWGGENRIVIASHFFWNGGNSIQKSQSGLLQTLLYKVLKEIPDLIESVCQSRWTIHGHTSSEAWDEAELVQAFDTLTLKTQLPVSFCFFIDGLDEYTAGAKRYHGAFADLFQTLYMLASAPSVKICVSSRPWAQFTESLGPRVKEWQLQMEDLTRGDIKNYVISTLGNNSRYKQMAESLLTFFTGPSGTFSSIQEP